MAAPAALSLALAAALLAAGVQLAVGQTPGSPESALTGAETGAGTGCSDVGQNCNVTGCCNDKGHTCFEKNPEWAMCMPDFSCMEGNHSDDAEEFRTPWSCKVLQKQCSGIFKQCGGTGWTGPICCAGGCMCNKTGGQDGYFWQCMPPSIHMSSCPAQSQTEIMAAAEAAVSEAMSDMRGQKVWILAAAPVAATAAVAVLCAVVSRVRRHSASREGLLFSQVHPATPREDGDSDGQSSTTDVDEE